jgi:hypothetical protein
MPQLPPRVSVVLVAFGASVLGCGPNFSRIASLPPDAGLSATYGAPVDEVEPAASQALATVGHEEAERSRPDSTSLVLLARRGGGLSGRSEVSRLTITALDRGTSEVWVVTRPSMNRSLQVVNELDVLLGPGAIIPRPGDRVRGRGATGLLSEGTVVTDDAGRLALALDDSERGVPLEAFADLEIRRGSYGRGGRGAAIGGLIGGVALLGALGYCFQGLNEPSPAGWCESSWPNVAPLVGAAVGALLGSAMRTSFWSALQYPR